MAKRGRPKGAVTGGGDDKSPADAKYDQKGILLTILIREREEYSQNHVGEK